MEPGLIAVVRKDTGQPAGYVTAEVLADGRHSGKLIPDPDQHPDLKQDGTPRAGAVQASREERAAAAADREHLASQIRGVVPGTVPGPIAAPTVVTQTTSSPAHAAPTATTTGGPSGSATTSQGG